MAALQGQSILFATVKMNGATSIAGLPIEIA